MPRNWENEFSWVIAIKGKSFCSITRKIAWGATIYHLWGHRNSRIQENNYAPVDTIFDLICTDVRLRISGLQKMLMALQTDQCVRDSPFLLIFYHQVVWLHDL